MITEFTCGIYTAAYNSIGGPKWFVKLINTVIAIIDEDGDSIIFCSGCPKLSKESLIELAVLMNNIKRQYKQLQTSDVK